MALGNILRRRNGSVRIDVPQSHRPSDGGERVGGRKTNARRPTGDDDACSW